MGAGAVSNGAEDIKTNGVKNMTPLLYDTVNFLYNSVMNHMPEALQERSMASAFMLGGAGTYGVVRGLQWASKNVVERAIPGFDKRGLPILEKVCIAGMAAAPIVYALVDPEGAKAIMTQHPTYTSGMAGIWAGSIAGAAQDQHERSLEKKLENSSV